LPGAVITEPTDLGTLPTPPAPHPDGTPGPADTPADPEVQP
jgi:hypothetical protein